MNEKLESQLREELENTKAALRAVLGDIDFTKGNCRMTDMVGACLSKEALARAQLYSRPTPV